MSGTISWHFRHELRRWDDSWISYRPIKEAASAFLLACWGRNSAAIEWRIGLSHSCCSYPAPAVHLVKYQSDANGFNLALSSNLDTRQHTDPMYLINTETLELKSFIDVENCPVYAILSHRWTGDEVTHKDFINGRRKGSAGHKKIKEFCKIARRDGIQWAWADTCCIDKRSSAELQEAINSMFRYYQASRRCYVYLADVITTPDEPEFENEFRSSQWFTRGWTLQEILAPREIEFYSNTWEFLGNLGRYPTDVVNRTLWDDFTWFGALVCQASGIQQEFLVGRSEAFDTSIACRMSWAARRETSRGEDIAYCLLGLFQVNMPLMYGEGRTKAFSRLQEEIMKRSDDHSLFAWTCPEDPLRSGSICRGLLAEEPAYFSKAGAIYPTEPRSWAHTDPYMLTSRGLKITLHVLHWADDVYLAKLDCRLGYTIPPMIVLRKVSSSDMVFQRIFCAADIAPQLATGRGWKAEGIYVQQAHSQDLYPAVWQPAEEFSLLEPQQIDGYRLNKVVSTGSTGDSAVVLRTKSGFTRDGYLLETLRSSGFAQLFLEHSPTGECLVITIAALSMYFIGFGACLGEPRPVAPRRTPSAEMAVDYGMRIFTDFTGRPLGRSSMLTRLGSRLSVPSQLGGEWCHSVELGIKTIHAYGRKKYTLELVMNHTRASTDEHDPRVLPPNGFTAEIQERPQRPDLMTPGDYVWKFLNQRHFDHLSSFVLEGKALHGLG